eukprot:scaffold10090_cov119-Cylindrotheca_fusiformis.AAC.1
MDKAPLHSPPTPSIVVADYNDSLPPIEDPYRAVHKVRLSALSHNYTEVESAANRQRCSVIVVVKADGYGHGAIASALFLADHMGADAFAVATLEEGIALRKAFQQTPPGSTYRSGKSATKKNSASSLFQNHSESQSTSTPTNFSFDGGLRRRRFQRASQIRILVLGPAINFPRCFDDYYYYSIEVMISGPEVARSLLQWVHNTEERKRTQVERAANEAKELAMQLQKNQTRHQPTQRTGGSVLHKKDSNVSEISSENSTGSNGDSNQVYRPPSATLGNVTGMDLAKEVRKILKNHMLLSTQSTNASRVSDVSSSSTNAPAVSAGANGAPTQIFAGIEEAAKVSRSRHKAIVKVAFVESGEEDNDPKSSESIPVNHKIHPGLGPRKRLRWHAIIDSGMGRLGFRTDPVSKSEQGQRRDTVEILSELVDLENNLDSPVEFFGMCTHMADANSSSTYTHSQIGRFKSLLSRVRAAGISVPTISTDNSAALLTTNLTHFDPKELLTQEFTDTRGFVRTGGAIYGQRPAFPQIKAISTLQASVRHVATLKKGESVGYDRAYIAPGNVRIATLAIGFADGYPRDLGNGVGKVAIRGSLFPVVGNVCMDMLMVDLGPAEDKGGPGAKIVVGDAAILWGPSDDDGEELVRLQDIAALLKTTQSALTCGLNKERVLRRPARLGGLCRLMYQRGQGLTQSNTARLSAFTLISIIPSEASTYASSSCLHSTQLLAFL